MRMRMARKECDIIRLRLHTLFFAVTLLILSTFILLGCEKQEKVSPYKLIDSGIWSYNEKTFWLDNERVLTLSNRDLRAYDFKAPNVLTIWNIKTGEISFSHEATGILCVKDGEVLFAAKKVGGKIDEKAHYRGPIENPEEYHAQRKNVQMDYWFDCGWVPRETFGTAPLKFPFMRKLRGDNYLQYVEKRGKDSEGKMLYHKTKKFPGVYVPFYIDPYYKINFILRENAYFVSPDQYLPEMPYYHSVWWVKEDGKITGERILNKSSFPARGVLSVFPLKNNYLAHYGGGGIQANSFPKAAGLYLIKESEIEKVLVGAIGGVSVSPDGCMAAFSHAESYKQVNSRTKPHRTVKLINFCEEGDKK
ncbi:MAG: hypothetical protein KKC21_04135 [Nitrospinae bacterium]|nr:hypothetical protein [Nitrospinota bacterium]